MSKLTDIIVISLVLGSLNGCILLAAGATGAEAGYVAGQPDRTAGETLDDQRITAEVKTKFLADKDVPGLDINVDTFKKVVTLKGVVKSDQVIEKAIEIAKSVSGVVEVKSKLFVG